MTDKPEIVGKFKSFISESEIEEKRKIRQEEWQKVRQPGQSIEAPEEIIDNRTLYERLQQQKDKKQEEYDESHKLKNQIRGLDNDEVDFLSHVSNRQSEILQERYKEEEEILKDFKKATTDVIKPADVGITHVSTLLKPPIRSNIKSQSELLSGAIKHKRSDEKDVDQPCHKLGKIEEPDSAIKSVQIVSNSTPPKHQTSSEYTKDVNKIINSPSSSSNKGEIISNKNCIVIRNEDIEAKVIGYLPGIGDYSEEDSDDSDGSSSNSEVEIKSLFPPIIRIKDVQKAMNQGNH